MRDILAWETCDICNRRLPTTICRVDGRVLRVCNECLITLQGLISCGPGLRRPQRQSPELTPNERLLSSLRSPEEKRAYHRTYRKRSSSNREPE